MRGWRIKFVFFLIVYFAGFATAIYTLAPVPENNAARRPSLVAQLTGHESRITSQDFAKSVNTGIHKCIDFGKDAAWRTAKLIKQKIDQKQLRTDG
ncbi:MAG: hypothetical protein WAV28_05545 [Sedimentisphaerales bacterium]|jgi:hypothetical protein